jgi:hypothetical protein
MLLSDRLCGQMVRVSWLQTQRPWFDSRHYQIFWEAVGLEWGPLRAGSGLEIREYGLRYLSRWPHDILYPQKLALTSPTSSDRSVGIVRSQTKAKELLVTRIMLLSTCLRS